MATVSNDDRTNGAEPKGANVNDIISAARLPVAQTQVAESLYSKLPEIGRMCTGVDPAQFLGACISEANSLRLMLSDNELKSPHVIGSFVKAAFNAAVVGLVPGGALGHCYFVPFKNNKIKGSPKMIQLVIGYRGFLELGFATGFLIQCDPEVVLKGEPCVLKHTETGPKLDHEIPWQSRPIPDRQNIEAAYCTYKTRGGGVSLKFVTRAEIAKVDSGNNVWRSNYHAMCLKTPIRRASKMWQLTRQLAIAVSLDEQAEGGRTQDYFGPKGDDDVSEVLDFETLVDDDDRDPREDAPENQPIE